MDLREVLQTIVTQHEGLGLVLLGAAACIEYVFPPFPGDTVTLAAGVLVSGFGWSLPLVFAVVTCGSLLGAYLDFRFGRWLHARRERRQRPGSSSVAAEALERVLAGFRRHGDVYLVVNRFLPGVRALFFVAAGLIGMRTRRVLLFAGLSAVAWNALIVTAGYLLGTNLERIERLFKNYALVVWVLLALVTGFFVVRFLLARRAARAQARAAATKPADPAGPAGPAPGA